MLCVGQDVRGLKPGSVVEREGENVIYSEGKLSDSYSVCSASQFPWHCGGVVGLKRLLAVFSWR